MQTGQVIDSPSPILWVSNLAACFLRNIKTSSAVYLFSISALLSHLIFLLDPFQSNQKLGYDYDYGVVRLADPFTLNAYVGTISVTKIEPEAGDCVTLGWGHIDDNNDIFFPCVLHHVAVPLVSSEKCEQIYQGKEIITKRMKCAGTAGKGFCIVSKSVLISRKCKI